MALAFANFNAQTRVAGPWTQIFEVSALEGFGSWGFRNCSKGFGFWGLGLRV